MKMETVKNCVLDKESINRKMRRMALEIAEQSILEKELIVAGINGNGEIVARCLINELNKVDSLKTTSVVIQLNKKEPQNASLSASINLDNKVVIVVDDVANT